METLSGIPALTIFRTEVRRKSWKILTPIPETLQALVQALSNRFILSVPSLFVKTYGINA